MKRTFNLGKIDYLNNGKKNCPVEIDLDGIILKVIAIRLDNV